MIIDYYRHTGFTPICNHHQKFIIFFCSFALLWCLLLYICIGQGHNLPSRVLTHSAESIFFFYFGNLSGIICRSAEIFAVNGLYTFHTIEVAVPLQNTAEMSLYTTTHFAILHSKINFVIFYSCQWRAELPRESHDKAENALSWDMIIFSENEAKIITKFGACDALLFLSRKKINW